MSSRSTPSHSTASKPSADSLHRPSRRKEPGKIPAAQNLVEVERLYTKAEAAEQLNDPVRFVERCVSQRRVRVIRLGRHIRIPQSALAELLTACDFPAWSIR